MSINIGPPSVEEMRPRITVIGVGGAGGNAVANMIQNDIEGVDFIVANTDAQTLNTSPAEHRIQLGPDITKGLGAGSRPEVGRAAAEETIEEIERALEGVNMVFIAAGMGGGTGTGAAPVIAEIARNKGVLTVGVVTKPFLFEGTRRMRAAQSGIEELQKHVDTLIVIPNQNLFLVAKAETTFKEAFQLADEVLQQGVRSITDLMVMPGLINLDFADVRSVMGEMGKAMMGTGEGEGPNRALEAAERAIANPLLDGVSMQGAKGVIISIIGGDDMKLLEVDEAANHIRELVDPEANIIWGSAFNPDLDGKIRVSVVATGIEQSADHAERANQSFGGLSASRGPKRPVLPLPTDAELAEEAAAIDGDDGGFAEPVAYEPPAEPQSYEPQSFEPQPFETPSFDQRGYEPAAPAVPTGMAEPAHDEEHATIGGGFDGPEGAQSADADDWDDAAVGGGGGDVSGGYAGSGSGDVGGGDPDTLELSLNDQAEEDAQGYGAADDEDVPADGSDEDRLVDAIRRAESSEPLSPLLPKKRRALVSGGEGGGSTLGAGSTLFERMANLSRGGPRDDANESEEEGEEEDDSSALNIPRFLGRQNNQ
jgi:cell division protein FtsZ